MIMAAGIGSRYGAGIKQLEPVGLHGEIIMDYSIHDALRAGFNKIVFVIRRDMERDFQEVIGRRIEKLCASLGVEVRYAFQELEDVPEGIRVPAGRTKPWGTGQAVLAARELIHEPFAVINADDYYGKAAFEALYGFLRAYTPEKADALCMAGFILKNTLSDNGGVTRGLCQARGGYLTDIVETKNIVKTAAGAMADGREIDPDGVVSMNMWGLTPAFMDTLAAGFREFFATVGDRIENDEYLLPIYIGDLLRAGRVSVKVLESPDQWFGITYKEDAPPVKENFRRLIAGGVYSEYLFDDLRK